MDHSTMMDHHHHHDYHQHHHDATFTTGGGFAAGHTFGDAIIAGEILSPSSHHSSSNRLCEGMGMIMYMDGFQWTLKGKGGCLNFYFPSWTLDTVSKFVTAMIVVVLLGIITEWIARLRHDVSKHHRRMVVVGRRRRVSDRLWYLQTALHGMNALCAYILMLATMTYSLELLCCVISGLVIGYWIFGGDSYTHAGSPCCAFLDDDCDGSNNRDDGTVLTSEFLSTYVDGGNGNNTEGQGNVDDDGRYETNDPHSDVAATTATTAVDDWNNNGTTTTSATGGGSCCGSHNKV